MEILKQESKVFPAQINLKVSKEAKARLEQLKRVEKVRINEMLRDLIDNFIHQIEETIKSERRRGQ